MDGRARREDETFRNVDHPGLNTGVLVNPLDEALATPGERHGITRDQMDPLSATASIAGLFMMATAIFKSAYALSSSAKEFQKEITAIADGVAVLSAIIHALNLKSSLSPISASSVDSTPHSPKTPDAGSTAPSSPPSTPSGSERDYQFVSVDRTQSYLSLELENELSACKATLTDINKFLFMPSPTRGRRFSNAARTLKWSWNKNEAQKFIDKLEKHKSTLAIILSSQGKYVPILSNH
jgi:hypothetical protein